ncbi:Eco57I restriction-modification methylase domain-containing protein [Glaesserella parasuis]|uniref:Eco57I restriction-modification methylase domain-containing protein n=1 Tax=Glaesserella parasuis TaxID=738 RepID=UPI003B6719CA
MKKFDVVLTNPPFGEDRAFTPKKDNDTDKAIIECYELWNLYSNKGDDNSDTGGKKKSSKKQATKIDLGVIFLENAYRILKGGGRMGIVLSNSIASIDSHKIARQWLMDKMRIVAIFDLPANVFAETGVNTSIIVAYKPTADELDKLKEQNYQVFAKDIQKVGYEVKTNKRVKQFVPTYKMDYKTFEVQIDNGGNPMLDEDFTQTITDFKQWCVSQEQVLQDMFIKAK